MLSFISVVPHSHREEGGVKGENENESQLFKNIWAGPKCRKNHESEI